MVKKFVKHFISEKNNLVSFDYSQIELRLAAEISKDNNFIKLLKTMKIFTILLLKKYLV